VYAQESSNSSSSSSAASDWQQTQLSADDVSDDVTDDEDDEPVTSPGVRRLRYTLTGLKANTSYVGRLRAENVFGASEWSSTFRFMTAARRMYYVQYILQTKTTKFGS